MEKYSLKITKEGCDGWEALVLNNNNEVILDSSHYGAFTTAKRKKEIIAQFRQELGIKRFYKIIELKNFYF